MCGSGQRFSSSPDLSRMFRLAEFVWLSIHEHGSESDSERFVNCA